MGRSGANYSGDLDTYQFLKNNCLDKGVPKLIYDMFEAKMDKAAM